MAEVIKYAATLDGSLYEAIDRLPQTLEEVISRCVALKDQVVAEDLRDTLSVTKLLTTSASAFAKAAGYDLTTYEKEEGDVNGPFALAVAISDTVDDGITGDIVWVSSTALVDDQTNTQVSGGNQDFFLNALGYLCQAEQSSLSIHAKSLSSDTLTMDSATVSALTIAVVGVIPAAVITLGIVIWIRRKRR